LQGQADAEKDRARFVARERAASTCQPLDGSDRRLEIGLHS
jgi:hypothetical protein